MALPQPLRVALQLCVSPFRYSIPGGYKPLYIPVAPVAYQVILDPGIGQFREFEPRRVHIRINPLGLFLVDKLPCGKRESVS